MDRIRLFGFEVVTIGGGDPFQYSFLGDLIKMARSIGLQVQLDTNGHGMAMTGDSAEILDSLTLVSLPLDGATAKVHAAMRNAGESDFSRITRLAKWITAQSGILKINTLVSGVNITSVIDMGLLVDSISPNRWSLYEYWPLSLGGRVSESHQISTTAFDQVVDAVEKQTTTLVERNRAAERRRTYPFVSQDGMLYIHSNTDSGEYSMIGSVFDDQSFGDAITACSSERAVARTRYNLKLTSD